MKPVNFTTEKKKSKDNFVQEKQFPGKPLDANVFEEKFNKANEVGRTIKGFKNRKK